MPATLNFPSSFLLSFSHRRQHSPPTTALQEFRPILPRRPASQTPLTVRNTGERPSPPPPPFSFFFLGSLRPVCACVCVAPPPPLCLGAFSQRPALAAFSSPPPPPSLHARRALQSSSAHGPDEGHTYESSIYLIS